MPDISVIIPVYNVEKHLSACLESVLNQTIQDIEIICINDGSTDASLEIAQKYAQKDKRLIVINQPNGGVSKARNTGLKRSTAQYIAFVDGDDTIHPRFLEILYSQMIKEKVDIIGCDFNTTSKCPNFPVLDLKPVKKYFPAIQAITDKKYFIYFNVWNKLFKRHVIKDVSFIEGIYYEDWVFNVFALENAASFAWIDEKLYGYRPSANSIMRSQFTLQKLDGYYQGIQAVSAFLKEKHSNDYLLVKKTWIAHIVKNIMKSTLQENNKIITEKAVLVLKDLYQKKQIGYRGLNFFKKIKLFRFLHL